MTLYILTNWVASNTCRFFKRGLGLCFCIIRRVSEAMEAYKRWVRQNKDYVHSIESLANGLTWLLPERFSESEIGPEAVTTILGIITAVNEHIIDTAPKQNVEGSVEPCSFPYPLCLSALKDLETLVEVVAQHYCGDDKKWNFLAVTEATKVLVRLSLFRKSGYKMLLHGGETPNEEEHSDSFALQHIDLKPDGHHRPGYMKNNFDANPMNMGGRALSALARFGEKAKVLDPMWLRRVQHQEEIMEPSTSRVDRPTLLTILSKRGLCGVLFFIGEVLFISRPLIYVLFIRKYGTRSWTPWFLSLAIDCIGNSFLSLVTTSVAGGKEQMFHLSAAEKDEVKRRKLLFALYLMRDPFFSKYTRQRLESTEKVLEPIPVIGFLTAKLVELIIGAQTRYTYMSGS
ncbi:Peroxisome biogenesis protein 16, partial [Mucuna pruriens]